MLLSNLGLTRSTSALQVEAEESGPANPDGKESQVEEDLLGEVSAKDFLPKLVRPSCGLYLDRSYSLP